MIKNNEWSKDIKLDFDDETLIKGLEYHVGTNDGNVFKNVTYTGTKVINGKPIQCHVTGDSRQLAVNPSYHTFMLETNSEGDTNG